jgi:hypothetical protein
LPVSLEPTNTFGASNAAGVSNSERASPHIDSSPSPHKKQCRNAGWRARNHEAHKADYRELMRQRRAKAKVDKT